MRLMKFDEHVVRRIGSCGLQGRERLLLIGFLASRAAGVVIGGPCWNRMRELAATMGYDESATRTTDDG